MKIKNLIAGVTACTMSICALNAFPAYAETEGTFGDLTYINYGDYIEITDCAETVTSVEIPTEIDGVRVTVIGKSAFKACKSLTSVVIPEGVTAIGDSAFYDCFNLTSINLPDSLTTIDSNAFSFCYDLAELNIPSTVTEIGDWSFVYCSSLTELVLPDTITEIGAGMFQGCSGLTSFDVPDSVTYIGMFAFAYCSGLTEIYLPAGIQTIDSGAFDECTSLTDVYYDGIAEEWSNVFVDYSTDENVYLANATIHFSDGSTAIVKPDVTTSTLGDVDYSGIVDPVDATLVLRQYAIASMNGENILTDEQINIGNVDGNLNADGTLLLDVVDATHILRYYSCRSMDDTFTWDDLFAMQ